MTTSSNPYDVGLDKNPANYEALTPLSFLAWSARVYPNRVAVIHGERSFTWAETYARARRLASALAGAGVTAGDTVATLLANTPELYEAHFGVPMTGAVLNALNTRLDPRAIAFMLEHGEAKVLLVDREFSRLATAALGLIERRPLVIDIDDPLYDGEGERRGTEYETFLSHGDPEYAWQPPSDEWNAIALSYTSGTTGDPKGVVTHHRGAHLNAIANALEWSMPRHAVYLWTLPMFHCNGWCFPWTMAAQAGTNICLRKVEPATIFRLMREHRVTHYCGAPVVHSMLVAAPQELREGITHRIQAMVAGASPPSSMIEGLERINIELIHTYGLTEVYGPSAGCAKQEAWATLGPNECAPRNGWQGVPYVLQGDAAVLDPKRMERVPAEMLPMQAQVGAAMAEHMKDTPMYKSYMAVAPKPEDFPRLLDRMGEYMRKPYDWSEDVKKLSIPVMIVFGDSDMYRPEHIVSFYKLLGGGLKDAGWMREHMARNRLAILPGLTHYDIFLAPELTRTVRPFLDGKTAQRNWK